ncbi:acyl-CoA thioesterase [Rhodococcus sp. NPDC003318]|uniref:acyl-CoA thioesterase n=1 Tax=Rhodococcus sp. NPDC003318 TaxID=3364503 RepID=UPI0036B87913
MTPLDPTDPAVHRTRIAVRWSDMDAFKHINHARMVTLLEEARVDWLASVDPDVAAMLRNSVVAHLEVRYRTPLTHADNPLEVSMWLDRVRSADLTVRYEVRAAGADPTARPAVEASTQLALGDPYTQTLRRLTTEQRARLAPWVRPS